MAGFGLAGFAWDLLDLAKGCLDLSRGSQISVGANDRVWSNMRKGERARVAR